MAVDIQIELRWAFYTGCTIVIDFEITNKKHSGGNDTAKTGLVQGVLLSVTIVAPGEKSPKVPVSNSRHFRMKNMERFTNLRVILAQGPC